MASAPVRSPSDAAEAARSNLVGNLGHGTDHDHGLPAPAETRPATIAAVRLIAAGSSTKCRRTSSLSGSLKRSLMAELNLRG